MKYEKIINLLDDTPSEPSTFKAKNYAEKNDESRRTYGKSNWIRFTTSMLRSSLCDYRSASIIALLREL